MWIGDQRPEQIVPAPHGRVQARGERGRDDGNPRVAVPGEDASAERRRGKPVGADSRATGVRERGVASNGDRTPETPRRA